MKSNAVRKILVAAMTGLFLVSAGAMAADKKCKKHQTYDPVKKECVKEKKK